MSISGSAIVPNLDISGTVGRLRQFIAKTKLEASSLDSGHPTERVHKLLADAIKRHLQEVSNK